MRNTVIRARVKTKPIVENIEQKRVNWWEDKKIMNGFKVKQNRGRERPKGGDWNAIITKNNIKEGKAILSKGKKQW